MKSLFQTPDESLYDQEISFCCVKALRRGGLFVKQLMIITLTNPLLVCSAVNSELHPKASWKMAVKRIRMSASLFIFIG